MSGSLLSRLYRYRQRETRSPLEAFLTETLVELLNLLPRHQMLALVEELFLPPEAVPSFQARVRDRQLAWQGQFSVDDTGVTRWPDLVLLAGSTPALAVEAKIDAGAPDAQLRAYGLHLAAVNRGGAWPGALAFLTHRSEPPSTFLSDTTGYGVPWRTVNRWSAVYRFLRDPSRRVDGAPGVLPAWCYLADQLCLFLEENDMAADTLRMADLEHVAAFLPVKRRLEETFKVVREHLGPLFKDTTEGPIGTMWMHAEGLCVWEWANLRSPEFSPRPGTWHLHWGIRFPGATQWWVPVAVPCAFVGLASNPDGRGRVRFPLGTDRVVSELLAGWTYPDDELIRDRPCTELVGADGEMGGRLAAWVAEQLAELIPIARALRAAAAQSTPVVVISNAISA